MGFKVEIWESGNLVLDEQREESYRYSIPNQEDHGFYPWVNWSSGTGCSPLVGVSWEPWALPVGLHELGA
jgi:hypothetical protein